LSFDNRYPENWDVRFFEELFSEPTRNGLTRPKKVRGSGIKMVNMGEIFAFDRIYNQDMARVPVSEKEYHNYILKKGDLLFARQSLTLEGAGKCSIIMTNEEKTFESHIIRVRLDVSKADPMFYYYLFKSRIGKELISSIVEQVAAAGIRGSDLVKLKLPYPEIVEQKNIVLILSSLDDKIELNNAINKNLEEMAQALFKRWFVDFEFPNENGEPYKSSGGEFEESELGLIPKGWSVGTFQDLISDIVGGDWGKEAPQGNYTKEVSCIRGADIPEITKGLLGKVPKRFILPKNATAKSLSHGDIIIEISGGSPTQSTGRSVLIIEEVLNKFNTPLICTNFCRVIKPIIGYSEFLYCYLSYLYNEDVFFQYENGTTGIKNLDIGSLFSVHKIVIPIKSVLQQYSAQYQAVYSTIQHLGRESDQLAQIRDTLLPKLMSGEIRVPVEQEHSAPELPMVAESSAIYQP